MTFLFGVGVWKGKFGESERRTADPSASPDFLSRVAASVGCLWFSLKRTTSGVADVRLAIQVEKSPVEVLRAADLRHEPADGPRQVPSDGRRWLHSQPTKL